MHLFGINSKLTCMCIKAMKSCTAQWIVCMCVYVCTCACLCVHMCVWLPMHERFMEIDIGCYGNQSERSGPSFSNVHINFNVMHVEGWAKAILFPTPWGKGLLCLLNACVRIDWKWEPRLLMGELHMKQVIIKRDNLLNLTPHPLWVLQCFNVSDVSAAFVGNFPK